MTLTVHKTIKSHQQTGFTLLEVLIAFVILSVGLLGIVNLQAMSKKFTHQAMQRTIAVSLAESIIERIRTNPGAIQIYENLAEPGDDAIASEPTPVCSGTAVCTIAEIAAHDIWEWQQSLAGATVQTSGGANASGLISPQACLVFDEDSPKVSTGTLTVLIQWTGLNQLSDAAAGGTICGGSNDTDLFRRQLSVSTYVIDETEL